MRGRISRTRSGKGEGVDAHEAAGWTEQEEGARAQGTAHPTRPEPAGGKSRTEPREADAHGYTGIHNTRARRSVIV